MRYPGVKEIYHIPASSLQSGFDSTLMNEIASSIIPLHILPGAVFKSDEIFKSNGSEEKVTITFSTVSSKPVPHGSCLVVEFVSGKCILVGDRENQPSITQSDTTASPSSSNSSSWSAEITGESVTYEVSTSTVREDEAELSIIGDMIEISEEEINSMLNNLN